MIKEHRCMLLPYTAISAAEVEKFCFLLSTNLTHFFFNFTIFTNRFTCYGHFMFLKQKNDDPIVGLEKPKSCCYDERKDTNFIPAQTKD